MKSKRKGTISQDEYDYVVMYIAEHGGFPSDADKKEEPEMSDKHEFESPEYSVKVDTFKEWASYVCNLGNRVSLLEAEVDRIRRNLDSLIYDVRCASVVYGGLFFLVAVYMVVRESL